MHTGMILEREREREILWIDRVIVLNVWYIYDIY